MKQQFNTINTLSDEQHSQHNIDREEAENVLSFYHEFSEGLFETDLPEINTVTMLRTNDKNGIPEVAFVIYKDLMKNREMVNYYEDAKQVMYDVEEE